MRHTPIRALVASAAVAALLAPATPAFSVLRNGHIETRFEGENGFEVDVSRISKDLKARMTGKSWHKGCPVPIRQASPHRAQLPRLRRRASHGEARRAQGRHRCARWSLPHYVPQGLQDPPHEARGPLRRRRSQVDARRQHLGLQLQVRVGDHDVVAARVRARHRHQPGREPLRVERRTRRHPRRARSMPIAP